MQIDYYNQNRDRLLIQLSQQNNLSLQFLRTAKELQELEIRRNQSIKNQ
jgi:hypothetical protein